MVGVSAGLIPFLEHDDANRALMGSNMQRQAVPLLVTEPPIVGTGPGARRRPQLRHGRPRRPQAGTVTYVDADRIEIDDRRVHRCASSSASTSGPARTRSRSSRSGEKVKKGQVIADGAATHKGELALGRNVLVAFMSWDGYNFEDAIIISERLVKNDTYTSIHIEEFDVEIRETKLGKRGVHPRHPERQPRRPCATSTRTASSASARSSSRATSWSARSRRSRKSELTPEEKLLHAIFGRAGEDVKNDSLEVPSGVEGIVIDTQRF